MELTIRNINTGKLRKVQSAWPGESVYLLPDEEVFSPCLFKRFGRNYEFTPEQLEKDAAKGGGLGINMKINRKQLKELGATNEQEDPPLNEDDEWELVKEEVSFIELPKNLTIKSYKELGELYSRINAEMVRVNQQLSHQKFAAKMAKMRFINLRSQLLSITSAQFKAKVFAAVNMRPEVKKLRQEVLVEEAKADLINSVVWSLKGYLSSIDFEVTRRRCSVQSESRD